MNTKSVCIFPHFYDLNIIPYYVLCYLEQLEEHFDQIIVVSNPREIDNLTALNSEKVKLIFQSNEGYDLGKYLKGFKELNLNEYHQIALINDSNIVFGNIDFVFDWARDSDLDFWGLVEANIRPAYSTHDDNYHIQSHFMVFNHNAIPYLEEFISKLKFEEIIKITDVKAAKRRVINDWEIGLSQFMLKQNLKLGGYVSHAAKIDNSKGQFYQRLIKDGVPVIKKKVITSLLPKDIFAGENKWSILIKTYYSGKVDVGKLLKELFSIRKRHVLRKIGISN